MIQMLRVKILQHGGIMVNYQCNAACRHCLYSCSPSGKTGYVDEAAAKKICRLLLQGGCRSVHIGGGEPFLNFNGLVMMIRELNRTGINPDYIETNAFWAADLKKAREYLECLLTEGINTLCISIDPFHAEYVPYGAPLDLAELCEKNGMGYFLWKQEFLSALSQLDPQKTHSRADMEKVLSKDYIFKTARLYGIGYGGRAVNIEVEMSLQQGSTFYSPDQLTAGSLPCNNLLSTGHFHVDKDCFFIPPRCTGIIIPLEEVVGGIPPKKYPAFEALYFGGISALLELALSHGFLPDDRGYPSKCNLCFYLRSFLSKKDFAELDRDHYEQAVNNPLT
jgi:hypothetical protein